MAQAVSTMRTEQRHAEAAAALPTLFGERISPDEGSTVSAAVDAQPRPVGGLGGGFSAGTGARDAASSGDQPGSKTCAVQ
eukprot:COSAG01_NODE_4154_length_5292_cov_6.751396_2_plen_80_part_00